MSIAFRSIYKQVQTTIIPTRFFSTHIPKKIKIVEVGPRDGLQNEKVVVSTKDKLQLIELLVNAGLQSIETTAFVSPKKVPQMADHKEIIGHLTQKTSNSKTTFTCLVPNFKGFENAVAAGAKEVAVLNNVSETLNLRNIGLTIEQSLEQTKVILDAAKHLKVSVRGYVSAVLGCPFEGKVMPQKVAEITKRVFDMGCYEVSLCDTIGIGTPADTTKMIRAVTAGGTPIERIAFHAHDTYGQGLVNVFAAMQEGVSVIDSSIAGLGGCPFAGEGAAGNVATEDVVYMLEGFGIETGINLDALLQASSFVSHTLKKSPDSRAAKVLLKKRNVK